MWPWACPVIYNMLQVNGDGDDSLAIQAQDNDE